MIRISDLAASLARGTVTVGGQTVDVRAVTFEENRRVIRLRPVPTPPTKHNTLGEEVADPEHPSHVEALRRWEGEADLIEAAIAIENQTADGVAYDPKMSDEAFCAWCEASLAELRRLDYNDVWAIIVKSRRLGEGTAEEQDEDLEDKGPLGKSSRPSRHTAEAGETRSKT